LILDDAATIERHTRAGWWGHTTVHDLFDACVAARPDQLALVDAPNRGSYTYGTPLELTYREADLAVDRLAAALLAAGVRRDSIVVVQLPNVVEIVLAFLACARLGAIVSPVMMAYRERDLGRIVAHLKPACVIGSSTFKQQRPLDLLRPLCRDAGATLLALGEGALADLTRG